MLKLNCLLLPFLYVSSFLYGLNVTKTPEAVLFRATNPSSLHCQLGSRRESRQTDSGKPYNDFSANGSYYLSLSQGDCYSWDLTGHSLNE